MNSKFLDAIKTIHCRFTECHAWWLYGMVRTLQPTLIVETGTCHGYLSAFLAQGLLDCGGTGRLISIDYYAETWPHAATGDRIKTQESLDRCGVHDVVELCEGPAATVLASLAASQSLAGLGMVILDDNHEYENVRHEIDIVWPHVVPLGVVGGHDCWSKNFIGVNQAFRETAKQYGASAIWSHHSNGWMFMQKPGQESP